jgi:uncharacterized RDD family membrane protein YckC
VGRFDEQELHVAAGFSPSSDGLKPITTSHIAKASLLRRLFALLTDVSLFAALTFALMPLIPASRDVLSLVALAGFVIIVSYYYFVGSWMLWRKTVGGTIFDVRVVGEDGVSMPLKSATMRWAAMWMSVATCGAGFLVALPDRLSHTRSV